MDFDGSPTRTPPCPRSQQDTTLTAHNVRPNNVWAHMWICSCGHYWKEETERT